jgi:hypothetical protein
LCFARVLDHNIPFLQPQSDILSFSLQTTNQLITKLAMDTDPSGSGGWRFAQCFGDKGEVEDITEGASFFQRNLSTAFSVLTSSAIS